MASSTMKETGTIPIGLLWPYEHNEDIYNKRDLTELAISIRDNGVLQPITINQDDVIISGNSRYAAAIMAGLSELPYKRVTTIDDDHLRKLVVEANNQRIKSAEEFLRESCPDEQENEQERIYEYTQNLDFDDDLQKEKKKKKSLNPYGKTYSAWTLGVLDIIRDLADYLPITLRAVHYKMMSQGCGYENNIKDYNKLSGLITQMRRMEIISYKAITDNTRARHQTYLRENKADFIRDEQEDHLRGYQRNLMQSQQFTHIILCEKETVSSTVNKVADKYGIRVFYTKGPGSESQHYEISQFIKHYRKPAVIYALTDHDPAGLMFYKNYYVSINSFGVSLMQVKAGITLEQIEKYDIPYDGIAKESDRNFEKYKEATGLDHAWELDALSPDQLMDELDEAILSHIDVEAYNREVDEMNKELEEIAELKEKITDSLTN